MNTKILTKGANVSINDILPGAKSITMGFSWDVIESKGSLTEVVASVIACGQDGQAVSKEHVVFFNQLMSPDESINMVQPSLTTQDKEQIEINLNEIPSNILTLAFILYVNPDLRNPGTLESMKKGVVKILDRSNTEVLRYEITPNDTQGVSAICVGELYKRNGQWKFRAVGQGYAGGIKDVSNYYGYSS